MSMKFITSTDLKQWADTKECQQLLPELIRKLIYASVNIENIEHIVFPSGDAVFLPGWDGIVSCKESFDMIPSGISLWEGGASNDVTGKINGDFNKRNANPLGYDKSTSTFVFVTPRLWEGTEDWLLNHGRGWKRVIVYTAVELESWIEKTPSVGMWLAERLRKLPAGGYMLPETKWNQWAQGKSLTLPYDIILHGRERISENLVESCKNNKSICLQTLTQNEGIAFAIATLMTNKDAEGLIDRTIVVTGKDAYNDLVEHYDNLIIITTLTEGIHYSTKRGHSVIVATTPADRIKDAIKLPIIEKEGFVFSLVNNGIDEAKARKIATDTARDINVLRRRLGIEFAKPQWLDSVTELLPAILVGKWNESCVGDKEIIEILSGIAYEQYESKLKNHLSEEESPLLLIANMWRVLSPYEAIEYVVKSKILTKSVLEKYRAICLKLIQDDDPKALDQLKDDGFHLRKFNQKYSNIIKKGVYQSLCLLSVLDDTENKELAQWVDETIRQMLLNWNLKRFLSNRHFLTGLAEASPNIYLKFVEGLSDEVLDEVFRPHENSFSCGWEVYYTELLWSLEMITWDEIYIKRVTHLLLRFSNYKNDSNYVNRPINSLYGIYRFYLPQTYVSFENRMTLLKTLSSNNRNPVYHLCKRICESLGPSTLEPNSHFKWRLFGKLEFPHSSRLITKKELKVVIDLMLQCCDFSAETVAELITLSSNANIGGLRLLILDAIKKHLTGIDNVQFIVDTLRKNITQHKQCENAIWALTEEELVPYQEMLDELEPKDVLHKYAWLFQDHYVQLPHKRQSDWKKAYEEQEEVRHNALQEIVNEVGEEGLWEFIQYVKFPESMTKSIVSIFDDRLNDKVCRKYKTKEISESFTKSYLSVICNKDVTKYQAWAEQMMVRDRDLTIVLFAPGYIKELADIAEKLGDSVKRNYWSNINIGFWAKEDVEIIVRELISVKRYSEAIEIISSNRESIQLSDVEIVQIIFTYVTEGYTRDRQVDMYYITTILEELDKSENPNVIKPLVFIEFLLYRHLEHRMNIHNLRLKKVLSRNPELMIQLVELAYLPDDKEVEQLEESNHDNRRLMAECAFHILHFSNNIVSFNNNEGIFDGEYMKQYIEELFHLAKERKRTKVIDFVIGNLLGEIPRDDNYPPQALCEIIEELNNDVIDESIRIRIFNSRGTTSRAYNEGGDQERSIVSKFEKYKEKTKLLYPRMTEIFNKLIKEYKNEAEEFDEESLITDLDY